jgi:hypothetical protein
MPTNGERMSRTSEGLKLHDCTQCRHGIAPGEAKTFDPGCRGCQRKLAAGLRTGNEPRPVKNPMRVGGPRVKRMGPESWAAFCARQKKARQVVLQTGQPNPHRRWEEAR